ncbi:MAG: hypothetical protein AAGI38_17435 [Bacteroidota bacterium]
MSKRKASKVKVFLLVSLGILILLLFFKAGVLSITFYYDTYTEAPDMPVNILVDGEVETTITLVNYPSTSYYRGILLFVGNGTHSVEIVAGPNDDERLSMVKQVWLLEKFVVNITMTRDATFIHSWTVD